jgi:ribosomal protein L11 methyltransferase
MTMKSGEIEAVGKEVIRMVSQFQSRLTPVRLEKHISRSFALSAKQAKFLIRDLISRGELIYTYQYGCTFLEQSFNRPVRVSKYVVLKPPGIPYSSANSEAVVEISPGAAFGTGQHPTTRLAIKGIGYALKDCADFKDKNETRLLDIGTGSGVLAITAALMGIEKGIGTDIDPCALAEARENIRLNGLENRIEIQNQDVKDIRGPFSIILANLRYPTLSQIHSHLAEITDTDGMLVLSGIKADERPNLLKIYSEHFQCRWHRTENDWAGVVFNKKRGRAS